MRDTIDTNLRRLRCNIILLALQDICTFKRWELHGAKYYRGHSQFELEKNYKSALAFLYRECPNDILNMHPDRILKILEDRKWKVPRLLA